MEARVDVMEELLISLRQLQNTVQEIQNSITASEFQRRGDRDMGRQHRRVTGRAGHHRGRDGNYHTAGWFWPVKNQSDEETEIKTRQRRNGQFWPMSRAP